MHVDATQHYTMPVHGVLPTLNMHCPRDMMCGQHSLTLTGPQGTGGDNTPTHHVITVHNGKEAIVSILVLSWGTLLSHVCSSQVMGHAK